MRVFDTVVVACDQTTLDLATAIRGVLEAFRLRVVLVFCVQKQNVLEVLRGEIPASGYIVLCSTGGGFQVVELTEAGWTPTLVRLDDPEVQKEMRLAGRMVVAMGCRYGRPEVARKLLRAGCRGYMGPMDEIDQDANVMAVVSVFYWLLSEGHEAAECGRAPDREVTDAEALERARRFDAGGAWGTGCYRYYGPTDGCFADGDG